MIEDTLSPNVTNSCPPYIIHYTALQPAYAPPSSSPRPPYPRLSLRTGGIIPRTPKTNGNRPSSSDTIATLAYVWGVDQLKSRRCDAFLRDPARCGRKRTFRYFGCDRTGPRRPRWRVHGPLASLSPKDGTGLRGSPAFGGGTSTRATDQPKSNSRKYGPVYCALTTDSDCNNYTIACMYPLSAHIPKL